MEEVETEKEKETEKKTGRFRYTLYPRFQTLALSLTVYPCVSVCVKLSIDSISEESTALQGE